VRCLSFPDFVLHPLSKTHHTPLTDLPPHSQTTEAARHRPARTASPSAPDGTHSLLVEDAFASSVPKIVKVSLRKSLHVLAGQPACAF